MILELPLKQAKKNTELCFGNKRFQGLVHDQKKKKKNAAKYKSEQI